MATSLETLVSRICKGSVPIPGLSSLVLRIGSKNFGIFAPQSSISLTSFRQSGSLPFFDGWYVGEQVDKGCRFRGPLSSFKRSQKSNPNKVGLYMRRDNYLPTVPTTRVIY